MANPIVTVDLRKHPRYQDSPDFGKVFDAEVLMLNINTGSARVRLHSPDTDEVFGNFDISTKYIVENEITVNLR